ncbi:hybrid sensor histidine kinase/response regulator transcription factor [Arenibacter sp. S6351L]|uniref:hybrid sensor histidine kinase/response regulator transcription factor n=1 Tax=Arenibacter sp. S6351L TaxID=2926407 RepID=UPI001FF1B757|nr:hybrid sensor histidine kinase/response regulator transcription factor [Arenibacter sp. S6351L]MCK0137203.1 response regulator [Arenibacter sp. S6351L]
MLKKSIAILLFSILVFSSVRSQEFYFKHYKVEDGLSHNTVLSSLQDKNGFMWFGTKNGLNRFDGYSFKLFQNNSEDPKSLHGTYIHCLHEFEDLLWVGTDNGLYSYNAKQENFNLLEGTRSKGISSVLSDSNGNLWYIANNSLYRYNIKTEETVTYPTNQYFNAAELLKTNDNEILAASKSDLFRYNELTNTFTCYGLNVEADPKLPFEINSLFSLSDQVVLLGTKNHGVLAYDIQEGKAVDILHELRGPIHVRNFALRGKEELWVASESGIHIYNFTNKSYTNLVKDYNNPYALADNAVYSLTVDNEGSVWAGTYFGGVNYFPNQFNYFKKYFPTHSKNSISGNAVREIHPDDYGNLWIGTEDGGLNKQNLATGDFTVYNSKNNGGILSHYNVHGVLPMDDKVWVSTFDHGLDVLDVNQNKIIAHYNIGEKSNLHSNFIVSLNKTRGNQIIVVSTSLQYYNPETDGFNCVEGFPEYIGYTTFYEDEQGVYWAGSHANGLFFYNPKTGENGVFKYDSNNPLSISSNRINGIFPGKFNTLWITTENGLNLYDANKRTFEKFGAKDGFPSNAFYSILEDDTQNLWITTSNGLVEYDPEKGSIKIFTKENGLLSNQFNYNSGYNSPDGTMYFGSVNGMISFNPENFVNNTYLPPILFTGLQINNQESIVGVDNSPLQKSVTFLDHLTLKAYQSSFSLDFAALSFISPESTEYMYQMKGISDDWIPLKKSHRVHFTQLSAGKYNLNIKSLTNNGVWGDKSNPLTIEVLPIFWKSNLAYSLYVMLLALMVFLIVRFYHIRTVSINNQRIKELSNKKEKEVYQAKIEFFTNISHEIRTPLTLIKSPLDKLIKMEDHSPDVIGLLSIMKKNTNRLLDLVNQLLDFRKTEMESISLTFVECNITELMKKTYSRFMEAIHDKDIDFQFNLGENDVIASVDSEALKKIFSNLIGNAIKYANRQVIVSLVASAESFKLKIQNDGDLVPHHLSKKIFEPFFRVSGAENQTGTGIGLALAHSLTKLHNGNLEMDNGNPSLNTFVLKLPLHQEKEFKLYSHEHSLNKLKSEAFKLDLEEDTNKPNIVIAEDSVDLLDFISNDLKELYNVYRATNGIEALKIIEVKNIQLVVTDVMMPLMDGYDLCRNIKSSLESSHIPVIFLTSKQALNAKIEGLESGADAYLEKPFSISHLRIQIKNLIENRKNIMTYYSSSPLAHLKSIALTATDETFIHKLDEVITKHISDPDLSVETLSDIMFMSRSTLYRKIKDMSDLSPNELINIARLKKAAELLKKGEYRIYEVSEMVGYNSQTSFGRNFQKQFNMTPTEYINS